MTEGCRYVSFCVFFTGCEGDDSGDGRMRGEGLGDIDAGP
jgi:hypothetical protein